MKAAIISGDRLAVADAAVEPDAIVREVVRRLTGQFHPRQIILFGSRARGDARGDSDYDFVVIMPQVASTADEVAMRLVLRGIKGAFDLVVVAQDAWQKFAAMPTTLEHQIAQEGQVVFHDKR